MAIFLLFFKVFIFSFYIIFKKREPLIKLFFTAFVRLKLRCKMSGVILKCAKERLRGSDQEICNESFLRTNRTLFFKLLGILAKMSKDYFVKIKRLLSEYQSKKISNDLTILNSNYFNARYASFLSPNSFCAST